MQHAGTPQIDGGGIVAAGLARAAGLHAYETHILILHKGVEHADGVGAASHARHHHVRQPSGALQHLRARLPADDGLELPDQRGERMGPRRRTKTVQSIRLMGNPVAQGRVNGVLQRAGTAVHGNYLRTQQLHAHHIHGLALHILCPHEDGAVHLQARRRRGRGHTVLARPGLRDEARLPHHPGKEGLAQGVVDLVGAGVIEILPL